MKFQSDDEIHEWWRKTVKPMHDANLSTMQLLITTQDWFIAFVKESRKLLDLPKKGERIKDKDFIALINKLERELHIIGWKYPRNVKQFYESLTKLTLERKIQEHFVDHVKVYIFYNVITAPQTNIAAISTYQIEYFSDGTCEAEWTFPDMKSYRNPYTNDYEIYKCLKNRELELLELPESYTKSFRNLAAHSEYKKTDKWIKEQKREMYIDPVTNEKEYLGTDRSLSVELYGRTENPQKNKRQYNKTRQLKKRLKLYKKTRFAK